MPTYEYECSQNFHFEGCGHVWEEYRPIAERMVPMCDPCPNCGKKDQIIRHFTAHHHHDVINPRKKMDENFKSEMERIKKEHPEMQSSYF